MATALRVFPPIERSPIRLLGVVNSEEELPSEGNQTGDAYILNQDLWIWTGAQWDNAGTIRGPQGDLGPSLRPRGELSHEDDLPLEGNQQGDIYTVGSHVWGWDGSEWINLGPFATGVIVHVREDEPPVAGIGDLWYDPTGTTLEALFDLPLVSELPTPSEHASRMVILDGEGVTDDEVYVLINGSGGYSYKKVTLT